MPIAMTVISYMAAFFFGAGFACSLIAMLIIRAARRAEQRSRRVVGGDGADLDVTGVMDSVSENR